jgi:hypothetical protein
MAINKHYHTRRVSDITKSSTNRIINKQNICSVFRKKKKKATTKSSPNK